ncbi:transcription antitermination factor NusB [Candidatus Babeliales bacterium]|nr:transcription antitermination factor NusB [Candidatus Babeliales bacterium]
MNKECNLNSKESEKTFKPTSRRDIRCLAFYLLYAIDRFDYSVSLEQMIENFRSGFNIDILTDSFAIEMVDGVIKNKEDIDKKMAPFLKNWRIERLGCCTRLILRLAIWEILNKKVALSVVINEAIELAKTFAEKDAYKFVNGILDELCKKMNFSEKN